jgi:radical SAM superfamily enzyme YgiQ (UPF0313 family)
MAQIILIQPLSGQLDEMSIRLPEGLLAIAALPVQKGYDIRIIDQRLTKDFERAVRDEVGPETVIFGVTCITGEQIGYAVEVTQLLKANWPNIPVVWGGVHATLLPEQTCEHPDIDYVVAGDGDLVFCELFERLRDGLPVDDLRGLVYKTSAGAVSSNAGEVELNFKSNGNYQVVRRNGSTDVIRDLDSLPPTPYELVDFSKYEIFHTDDGSKSATLNTARGCPFRCRFCSDPVLNDGKWRGLTPDKIIERLVVLFDRYNVRWVFFQDDYFPGSKKRFLEILERLTKYNGSLKWSTCGIRADIICKMTPEEMNLLERSGCHSLEMGIESGSERIITLLNKAETLEEMREANRLLAKTGIKVKYSFIIGFPTETDEEMESTIDFALDLERVNPNAYCFVFNFLPIVGTPFFHDAVQQGFKAPTTLEGWAEMDFQKWMRHYSGWHKPEKIRKLEAIAFTSYFHNTNVLFKLGGSKLIRFCYRCYYPVAKWRFENKKFGFFVEWHIKDAILALRPLIRTLAKAVNRI